MYKCPVCGVNHANIESLAACIEKHKVAEAKSKEVTERYYKLINEAAKGVKKCYDDLQTSINAYNRLVDQANQNGAHIVEKASASLAISDITHNVTRTVTAPKAPAHYSKYYPIDEPNDLRSLILQNFGF